MKRSVLNAISLKRCLVLAIAGILFLNSFAQTVTIVPTGTSTKPNLIPVDNSVTFSINPIGFGSCMNNLSYSWAILNSKNDTVYKSTSGNPMYNFTIEDVYTVTLTVKTIPGGYCSSNITRSASSTIKVTKLGGKDGAPAPNMFSANALGTYISAYTMDASGQILSGPYDYFDPFPADNAITAALSMDNKGNFFYLPTFMNGGNPLTATPIAKAGVVEVWAVDKNGNNSPVVITSFDMNGSSTAELGLYRMGLDQKGNAWILAGDGVNMYVTTFKTDGTKVLTSTAVTTYAVPFESGSATDFQSGDLAFDNKGNMYVLAGSSTGVNIYTMPTNTTNPTLSKKWKVTDAVGKNFGLAVTGTVFDSQGNMYFSALDGIYFIDYGAVNAATATAIVKKVSDNFGLMDLATSQFPAAWIPPIGGGLLPVKLNSFAATLKGKDVNLTWTANEQNVSHYIIQRSTDGKNFSDVAVIFANNASGISSYTYKDADVSASNNSIFYRLQTVENNTKESSSYSEIRSIRLGQNAEALVLTTYPNPVIDQVKVTLPASWQGKPVVLQLYNTNGILVQSKHMGYASQNETIELRKAPKGLYIMKAICSNQVARQQIVKN